MGEKDGDSESYIVPGGGGAHQHFLESIYNIFYKRVAILSDALIPCLSKT